MSETSPSLAGLNPAQFDAVCHSGGPLLVVAGAGSGKTRVLTHRIAHLLDEGMSPFEILAITFTNKAAKEMQERVAHLVGPTAKRMWVSTFHSACVRILRQDAHHLGFPSNFSIYDQADARRLTGYVIRDLGLDQKMVNPRRIHGIISSVKNDISSESTYRASAEELFKRAEDLFKRRVPVDYSNRRADDIYNIYKEYQTRLEVSNAMDFDDLLMRAVEVLNTEESVREYWQNRFAHVLVDEYQDTNSVQNELVLILAQHHREVTVVGDGDQSIYAFRGADLSNILEFERAFPDATTIVLDQNYRSTQTILTAANAVIANNMGRVPKDLWTDRDDGDKIVRYHATDEHDEARYVTHELTRLRRSEGLNWDQMALFYRTNSQSRVLEENLVRFGIPYQVVGGARFYDRREIKDAAAYLRAIVNPADEVSIKRVLNVPKRGVGASSVNKLNAWAKVNSRSFYEALQHYGEAGVTGPAARGIEEFLALASAIRELDAPPATIIEEALERSGYLEELREEHSIEAENRLENLSELIGMAQEYESVDEFLEQISLVTDTDAMDDNESLVTLMTLHAAKGLEFPVVFLTGMEDGLLPHIRTLGEPRELEEERRLAYVGVTRAMRKLYLTFAGCRMLNGATQYNPPSRFVEEIVNQIPRELIVDVDAEDGPRRSRSNGRSRVDGTHKRTFRRDRASRMDLSRFADRGPIPPTVFGPRLALKVGDGVRHKKWGDGVVVDMGGSREDPEATVNFAEVGQKVLLVSLAPLEKL
ncbi:MAG: UvrD-helicase domain-containing protein [Acidimicrobiia bacterium]|nr:UvrD-helicase domain-containing protein [Acidimicrobiia bacterium]MCY4458607.1 UvrD-helicase domain-containing protein [Acidimicrobiaceae bacterium]